jgi:hypothetical protein
VRQLVGHEYTAKNPQARTRGRPFKGSVVHDPDELGGDKDIQVKLEAGESSYAPKHLIGPVEPLERDVIVLQEGSK